MSEKEIPTFEGLNCPLPINKREEIIIGHGSGGKLTQDLINKVFLPQLSSPYLLKGNDFADVTLPESSEAYSRISISTDSHVITPLIFPGGDIGKLAICGTVNDVAMSGAIPKFITVGFILEEGLSIKTLEEIIKSMHDTAREAEVEIIAGDTKVVERNQCDGLFINTTGIGFIPNNINIGGQNAQPGDAIIISGTIGDHGIAILNARNELGLETTLKSDVAPLNHLITDLVNEIPEIHVLRDPTRGGLATTLNEIAVQSNVGMVLDESSIPVNNEVRMACELLGFDPLYIANEGKVIIIAPNKFQQKILEIIKKNKYGKEGKIIGHISDDHKKRVLAKSVYGSTRIIDTLSGELLPRIC